LSWFPEKTASRVATSRQAVEFKAITWSPPDFAVATGRDQHKHSQAFLKFLDGERLSRSAVSETALDEKGGS
jgi:hypothetical protein